MEVLNAELLSAEAQAGLHDYFLSKKFRVSANQDWAFEHPYLNERLMMEIISPTEIRQAAGLGRAQIVSIGWQSQTGRTTVTLPSYTLDLAV